MIIRNANDIITLLNGRMSDLMDEQLTVVCLNHGGKVISANFEVTKGTDTCCPISVKQIARIAVLEYASGVILIHNHPSGDPRPSKADVEQTAKVREGLKLLDIDLMDHIIIGDGNYFSFCDDKVHNIL